MAPPGAASTEADARRLKRLFDLSLSLVGILLLFPLMGLVSLVILLLEGPPVLFRQQRVGQGGAFFWILKFRTMRPSSSGLQITADGDPRVYPFGVFLRGMKLDELPQLFNVLRGEMSFVGPRPEVERYVALYSEEQREVLRFTPGITDPASLKYRNESQLLGSVPDPEELYVERILPDKIRINLAYARQATGWSDFRLIVQTLLAVMAGSPRSERPRSSA